MWSSPRGTKLRPTDFQVPVTVQLPAFSISGHSLDTADDRAIERPWVVADLNHASLDKSIRTTQFGVSDVLGWDAEPSWAKIGGILSTKTITAR